LGLQSLIHMMIIIIVLFCKGTRNGSFDFCPMLKNQRFALMRLSEGWVIPKKEAI
jgi:hypothetical protein